MDQVMAWHQTDDKSSPEPILIYRQFGPSETKFSEISIKMQYQGNTDKTASINSNIYKK